jgi:hypothetical protein
VPGSGALVFGDGLVFNPTQPPVAGPAAAPAPGSPPATRAWAYLAGHDRRLFPEHAAGVRAAVVAATGSVRVQAGAAAGADGDGGARGGAGDGAPQEGE